MAVVALLTAACLRVGCGESDRSSSAHPVSCTGPEQGSRTITDLAGRQVKVTVPSERVVAISPGALRLVCDTYAALTVTGIEKMEKQWSTGRPYILAHPELLSLPVIGQGGPDSTPDPEMLLKVEPDVIFVAYLVDVAKADKRSPRPVFPWCS